MKKAILFNLIIFLIVCSHIGCNMERSEAKKQSAIEIPTLLDRPEGLQNGLEWDEVQNMYGSLRKKISQNNATSDAHIQLAQLFIQEARITGEHGHYYPAALKLLDEVLQNEQLDKDIEFRTLATKAGVQLSLHQFPEALATGKKAVALNPYNTHTLGVMVDAYVELGAYEEAVEVVDKMVNIRPDIRSYARVSYLREIHGDVDGAIEAMKLAIKAGYPGFEETCWARLTLGDLYKTYGDLEQAAYQYQKALDERPNYPFAIAALAGLKIEKGDYKEAEKQLQKAIDLIPEVGFYVQLAELYQTTGKDEKEIQALHKEILAMLADNEANGHLMNLEYAGLYMDHIQDHKQAKSYLDAEYITRPENIDVNKMLAKWYLMDGNAKKATFHLKKAGKTNSKDPELVSLI